MNIEYLNKMFRNKMSAQHDPQIRAPIVGLKDNSAHFRTTVVWHNHARGAIAAKACASSIGKGNTIVVPRSLAMSNNVPR